MLEAVRPNLSLGQGRVGRHEVAEFLDFDFQALLGGNLFHVFHDLGMRSRIDADDHGLIRTGVPLFRLLVAAAAGRKNTQGRQRAGSTYFTYLFIKLLLHGRRAPFHVLYRIIGPALAQARRAVFHNVGAAP